MITIYADHGIQFQYPDDWEVEEVDDGHLTTITVNATDGVAFALLTIDTDRPSPVEMANLALQAMRDEYPALDADAVRETIGGHPAVGHDVEFLSLDLTNACAIRAFRTASRSVLIFCQWSDVEDPEIADLLTALRRSVTETDE